MVYLLYLCYGFVILSELHFRTLFDLPLLRLQVFYILTISGVKDLSLITVTHFHGLF